MPIPPGFTAMAKAMDNFGGMLDQVAQDQVLDEARNLMQPEVEAGTGQRSQSGLTPQKMVELAQRTRNPQDMLKTLGAMDQLQGRDKLDKAGREIVRAFHQNGGTLPGKVLADIGQRYNLRAQQLAQIVKLVNDAGALTPKQTPMGQTVQAQNYPQAVKAEGYYARSTAPPEGSAASKKFRELRRQGYSRQQARQLAYGNLPGEDKGAGSDTVSSITMTSPDGKSTVKVKPGSKRHKRYLSRNWQEGKAASQAGAMTETGWYNEAKQHLDNNYGKITDMGFVLDEGKRDEYNHASDRLREFKDKGLGPIQAANKAMKEARQRVKDLESIPNDPSSFWGGVPDETVDKVSRLLEEGYDTKEVRDYVEDMYGWDREQANSIIREAGKRVKGQQ